MKIITNKNCSYATVFRICDMDSDWTSIQSYDSDHRTKAYVDGDREDKWMISRTTEPVAY